MLRGARTKPKAESSKLQADSSTRYAIRNTQYAIRYTLYTLYAVRHTLYAIRFTKYAKTKANIWVLVSGCVKVVGGHVLVARVFLVAGREGCKFQVESCNAHFSLFSMQYAMSRSRAERCTRYAMRFTLYALRNMPRPKPTSAF